MSTGQRLGGAEGVVRETEAETEAETGEGGCLAPQPEPEGLEELRSWLCSLYKES